MDSLDKPSTPIRQQGLVAPHPGRMPTCQDNAGYINDPVMLLSVIILLHTVTVNTN
jgi:hypothetical protein